MACGHRRPRLKTVLGVGLAVVVLVTVVTFVRHPWAVAALREGTPSETWPGDGRFVDRGTDDVALGIEIGADGSGGTLADTTAFRADFEQSNGAAIVVLRGDEVVYARFGEGFGPDTRFNSFSMAKSLVGLLVLEAISDGVIPGFDSTVGELWPDARSMSVAPVTVQELLDMRSGIAFEKDPGDVDDHGLSNKERIATYGPFSNTARLHIEGVDAVLADARLIEADRGLFSYQQLNTAILGRILEEVRGQPLEQLVDERLAEPAGAGGFYWRRYTSADEVSAYCCIYATAMWWARIGRFVLDNGPDGQFLTDELHAYALGLDYDDDVLRDGEYRSQIRYDILDRDGEDLQGPFVYFSGLGGQITYLVPGEDLVIVRFGDGYQLFHSTLYEISHFTGSSG